MNTFSLNTKTFIMVNVLICFFFSCFFVTLHFSADGDVANTPTTWNEVSKYGILALKYWGRTTDSWYLSVYPIHYIVFYLFGASITIIKFLEIAQIFSLSITIAFICYNETKNKFSFLLAPILSSLSSFAFSVGYIAHPASHNITNLYGLFCVLLFIFNTKKTINVKDVLTCFLSIIAAVSDPWFLPSYYLPLLISIAYKAFYKKEKDIR
ncbi:hypothetical protein [Candidatus Sodalis sp. SoCistrobi]|uniref:hypothetical protein n=1 Tax=Candidatus Sodalis sp. SoCistrobi TaxID=1922216 RepID=UPI000F78093F|nr:hypothetical protein [Candidatus Sodalis sp. SoCistrobi]